MLHREWPRQVLITLRFDDPKHQNIKGVMKHGITEQIRQALRQAWELSAHQMPDDTVLLILMGNDNL